MMWLLAQATGGANNNPFDNPFTYVNFGVLGVMVAMLLAGYLWPKPSVMRLIEERDRLLIEKEDEKNQRLKAEEQRNAMAMVLQDKLLPVVGDFVTTTSALTPMLQQVIPVLQEALSAAKKSPPKRTRQTGG